MSEYEGNKKKGEKNRELESKWELEEKAQNSQSEQDNLTKEKLYREKLNRIELNNEDLSRKALNEEVFNGQAFNEWKMEEEGLNKQELNMGELNTDNLEDKQLNRGQLNRELFNIGNLEKKQLERAKIKKKKKRLSPFVKIFGMAALITMVLIGMVALAGVTVYKTFIEEQGGENPNTVMQVKKTDEVGSETPVVPSENLSKTVAVFGTDITGKLTDVIFVVHLDDKSKEVNVIAVPRDTKVEWTKEQIEAVPARNQWVRSSKINEMTSLGGIENIRVLTIQTIEQLMGIKVDHYVVVNLNAFREIVDAIGGVEVEVKQHMKKDDFSQNLHIDLYPGLQILDGDKAEQFVRFRSYKTGDIGRIEAQQQFLQALTKKILSPEIIVKLPQISKIIYESVETDMDILEMLKYVPYVKDFQAQNLHFYTLPGDAHYEDNLSFYFLNQEEVIKLVDDIFFKTNN